MMSNECQMKVECAERLARIEVILDNHIYRTELNEKAIEEFKKFQWKILGMATIAGPVIAFLLNRFLKV